MKKYYIATYGCQMNESDSERIAGTLEKAKYKLALSIDKADLIVVNMCSVRQTAVDRIYGIAQKLKKLKKENNELKTILTGCILKKDRKKLSEKFDYVLDINNLPRWPIFKQSLLKNYLEIKPKYQSSFSALVPIMTGCNNFCSYCVVPYVRGREVSRPADKIICEIKNLIKKEYKEIWLLGQNVNSYKSGKVNFPKLLKKVNNIPGKFWVRFTSSHPKDFSDELIEAMANCKKVTEYLNFPVQSGDNKILKKMNRPYTIKHYKNLIKKIRSKIPNIVLSTDIIVGFPGETKKQFENSVKLFGEIKYDMAYISQYSPRPETSAVKLKNNVPQKEKKRRKEVLNEILKETALKNNGEYIGKEAEALIDGQKKNKWLGKTRSYKNIQVESSKNLLGKFIKIKITKALPWGLKGELL